MFLGFPGGSAGKESACNVGDLDLIPGLGRSPGEGNGYQLQYSGLENSMDCIVHGVSKSQTRLSDFHFHTYTFRWHWWSHAGYSCLRHSLNEVALFPLWSALSNQIRWPGIHQNPEILWSQRLEHGRISFWSFIGWFPPKWVAVPFSRGSSPPTDWTQVSCIASRFFTICATREAHLSKMGAVSVSGLQVLYWNFIYEGRKEGLVCFFRLQF